MSYVCAGRQRVSMGATGRQPNCKSPRASRAIERWGDPSVNEVRLGSLPESAAAARQLSIGVLQQWSLPHLCDVVELLVSELVGNAVRHTGARSMGLRLTRRRGWIRVEVRDPSRALPCLLDVRPLDEGGRGLILVDKFTDRWGVDLLLTGKITWFEIRVPVTP